MDTDSFTSTLKPEFSNLWKDTLSHLSPAELSVLELHFSQAVDKLGALTSQSQIDRETQLILSSIENGAFFAEPEIFRNTFVRRFRAHFALAKRNLESHGAYYQVQSCRELIPVTLKSDFSPFFSSTARTKSKALSDLVAGDIKTTLQGADMLSESTRVCVFSRSFHDHVCSLVLAHFLAFLLRDLNAVDNFDEEIRKYLLARQQGSFNQLDLLEALGLQPFLAANPSFADKFEAIAQLCSGHSNEGSRQLSVSVFVYPVLADLIGECGILTGLVWIDRSGFLCPLILRWLIIEDTGSSRLKPNATKLLLLLKLREQLQDLLSFQNYIINQGKQSKADFDVLNSFLDDFTRRLDASLAPSAKLVHVSSLWRADQSSVKSWAINRTD